MQHGTILCVDDDPVNLGLVRNVLQDEFRLAFARSGTDAIAAAQRHKPSLILLDIQMPDMDGFTVARHIKLQRETESTPIIFVTARSDELDEEAGFEAGGVDYISKPFSPSILRARVRSHISLVRAETLESSYRAAIYMLGEAGHYNDNDTGLHIWRMAAFSRMLALAAGWDEERAALLELAAPMHDMGKIGVPDSVLKKPGPLTDAEWVQMRMHTQIGHDILIKGNAPIFQQAAEIALNHHERWDGGGYPNRRSEGDIPEGARIVAVADVFDALSMRRPYKDAWSLDRIVATLEQGAGSHFDAKLVNIFKSILRPVMEEKARWDQKESVPVLH